MTITELPHRPEQPEQEQPTARWIPARAGILNVWRYYDETFEFHNGRLLLRGRNGTGKSKALEILLPYLFDASLRANRLSTFGTSERTMHWNLMGEGATGTTRVGYVWLEFALAAERDEWFTCGARLQASTRTTSVIVDYFTTTLRVGVDLELTNTSGQPLTRAVLTEELGEHGTVHPTAADYRSAVRQTLFAGLPEQRYDALLTALLQLRTPKLSQRLDPALLSTLLSRALPPLDQENLAELAEGFERLDQQRERLNKLDAEVEAAGTVAARQRSYAQRVLRANAATLINATSTMDRLNRVARASDEAHAEAVAQREDTETRLDDLSQRISQANARIDGLTSSASYREGQRLDELRQQASRAQTTANDRAATAAAKASEAATDRRHAEHADADVAQCVEHVHAAATDAEHSARRAGLDGVHNEIAAELDRRGENARPLLSAAVLSRQGQIAEVRTALDRHENAVNARTKAEGDLDAAREDFTTQQSQRDEVVEAYDAVVQQQEQALLDWANDCRALVFEDTALLAECAESETAVLTYVDQVAGKLLHAITTEETTLDVRREQAQADRDDHARKIDKLCDDEVDLPPKPPPYRTADRTTMPGAPLWQLVRFADDVRPGDQTMIEAALQASGLLDAWLSPSGNVTVDGHDTFAVADLLAESPGRSLRDVLRPEPDGAVPSPLVERLLASVALGETLSAEHPAAIGLDGRWRLGPTTGSWAKDDVEHIGAAARERSRQRRIAELTAQLAEADHELGSLRTQLDVLANRRSVIAAERKRRPSHEPVRDARRRLEAAEAVVASANRVVTRASEELYRCEQHVSEALRALSLAGAEHRVPTDRAALDGLARAVDAFRNNADAWLTRHERLIATQRLAELRHAAAERSADAAAEAETHAEQAAAEAETFAEKLAAIERTLDTDDYQQLLAELDELRQARQQHETEHSAASTKLRSLDERFGSLTDRRKRDADDRDDAISARDAAAERLRHLATGTLTADANVELALSPSEGVRATLEAARSVAARWPTLAHEPKNIADAYHRLSETVHECRDTLSGHADLELDADDDVQILTAVVDGARVGAHELHTYLRAAAERGRNDITAAERDLFDKTLTGDTRRQLAERIRQANEMVEAMNSRLERVRTASQVAVRLVWQVDQELPAGTKDARELLLKDPVRLSEADRESLHLFFRDRIEQAKADNTASSWQEQLAEVFDYTAWHRFVVKLDRADGRGWQPLTKKLHGALSGGEKAIALHLPLFAAVAAHYQSVPRAPRLILLDEVFVGVDSSNRGQVFELLASLDLDLVLTSDHEWCAYRELPGIAVHQLITGDDEDDAVTTARFVWTGADWVDDDRS